MKVFAVITADGLDQCCYTKADAQREVKDLKGMGFEEARIKEFASDADAYDWHDRRR